jgi:hypothetical protein
MSGALIVWATDHVPSDCERNDTEGGDATGEPTIAEVPETATGSIPLVPFGTITSWAVWARETLAGSTARASPTETANTILV